MDAEEGGWVAERDPHCRVYGKHLGGHARDVCSGVDVVALELHALRGMSRLGLLR